VINIETVLVTAGKMPSTIIQTKLRGFNNQVIIASRAAILKTYTKLFYALRDNNKFFLNSVNNITKFSA
jgi:hypothetical protein